MPNAVRFPASRELFKVVRTVADQRNASDRISDVEIGRAIGFESARTSRWKHGQIAVSDSPRLLSLSQSFDIDLAVLAQVAAGYIRSEEALDILSDEGKLIRFLGEQVVLPANDQVLSLTGGDGTSCRIIRRLPGHYHRRAKRVGSKTPQADKGPETTVVLADNDKGTIEIFRNLTGPDTGVKGVVARSGTDALLYCGKLNPELVIFDLFVGQVDGFAAIKSLAANEATQDMEVIATSLTLSQDVVRAALGSGAQEVLQRPLSSSTLNRLIGRVRAYR